MSSKFDPHWGEILKDNPNYKALAKKIGCSESAVRTARWRKLNSKKDKAYRKNWRKENPEKFRAQCERYRKKSSVTNARRSYQKEKGLNSNQTSNKAPPPTNIPREIDWMQWEDDLIFNSGKSHKELSDYLDLPTAKIKRRELYLIDEERRMQKKAEIPLACGSIADSCDLRREIEKTNDLISRFKKDLDWENNKSLQEILIPWNRGKEPLSKILEKIEDKLKDMEEWSDYDSKNRDLLIIPYFKNIYKIIEMAYENQYWDILYIKSK